MNNFSSSGNTPRQCASMNVPHRGIKFQWNLKELIKACRKRWWEWIFSVHLHFECLSFLCLACFPLNLFPCSAPRGSPSTPCLAAFSPPGSTPLLYKRVQGCDLPVSTSKLSPEARLCDWVRTLILPSEMTFLYSLGFVQSRQAHAHRDGSGIAARARKRELPLNSPSREELLSPTPCLHVPCRDSILPSLSDFACPSPAFPAYQKTLVPSSHVSCFSRKPPIPQDF